MLLSDYGASVLRIDRPQSPSAISRDGLARGKSSVIIDLKSPSGLALLRSILAKADILIDPFRPSVLDSLGLSPASLFAANPRLVIGHLTGFRRDGKYAAMAGHDINYIAVSGILSQLGRAGQAPYFPANLLGDFAGGGLVCVLGILMALFARQSTGRGQEIDANMVDGSAYVGSFLRQSRRLPFQDRPRGQNLLDGGSPWYDVYECADGGYMAVGALEPQFWKLAVEGLGLDRAWNRDRLDRERWPELRGLMERAFKSKSRAAWEAVFDGKDACCTPVLGQDELEESGYEQRPAVGLSSTPSKAIDGEAGWNGSSLAPGQGGESVLKEWMGWEPGKQYTRESGGLTLAPKSKL